MTEQSAFDCATKVLTPEIKGALNRLSNEIKESVFEIRLRADKPVTLYGKYGTVFVKNNSVCSSKHSEDDIVVTSEEIKEIFNRICGYSVHTYQKDINNGFVTIDGGNRVGICGTAVCENGKIKNIKDISSINIRIAKEVLGCGVSIASQITDSDSVIIAGPPNSGKTTVLRDIVRQLSEDGRYKIAVIDERREIAGVRNGVVTNNIGITTDVLDSYPKAQGIDIAIRTLSPHYIVCDEVSTEEEIYAIKRGVNSGVKFIVTVHAGSQEEIMNRKQIEELINTYSFSKLFLLDHENNIGNVKTEYNIGELRNEIYRRRIGFDCVHSDWV